MDTAHLIEGFQVEGNRLAEVAATAGMDAWVPTCPEWRLRDLVWHTGGMHRWARAHIERPIPTLRKTGPMGLHDGERLPDDRLIAWYLAEVDALTHALEAAPNGLDTATYLLPDEPRHFWARRQCHETEIHRTDAEMAGGMLTPIDAARSADGIDEMLFGFASRPTGALHSEAVIRMVIAPDDTPARWSVTISSGPLAVERSGDGGADLTVTGRADTIYRCLWNRADIDDVNVVGDPAGLVLFKDRIKVGW